jgi:hypothetical protein
MKTRYLTPLLLLSIAVAGSTRPALAQIATEKPGKVKANNRRALREVRKTDTPYKDTHLDVPASRLKRGSSEAPQPEAGGREASSKEQKKEQKYKTGKAPNVKEPGIFGVRRKKKL